MRRPDKGGHLTAQTKTQEKKRKFGSQKTDSKFVLPNLTEFLGFQSPLVLPDDRRSDLEEVGKAGNPDMMGLTDETLLAAEKMAVEDGDIMTEPEEEDTRLRMRKNVPTQVPQDFKTLQQQIAERYNVSQTDAIKLLMQGLKGEKGVDLSDLIKDTKLAMDMSPRGKVSDQMGDLLTGSIQALQLKNITKALGGDEGSGSESMNLEKLMLFKVLNQPDPMMMVLLMNQNKGDGGQNNQMLEMVRQQHEDNQKMMAMIFQKEQTETLIRSNEASADRMQTYMGELSNAYQQALGQVAERMDIIAGKLAEGGTDYEKAMANMANTVSAFTKFRSAMIDAGEAFGLTPEQATQGLGQLESKAGDPLSKILSVVADWLVDYGKKKFGPLIEGALDAGTAGLVGAVTGVPSGPPVAPPLYYPTPPPEQLDSLEGFDDFEDLDDMSDVQHQPRQQSPQSPQQPQLPMYQQQYPQSPMPSYEDFAPPLDLDAHPTEPMPPIPSRPQVTIEMPMGKGEGGKTEGVGPVSMDYNAPSLPSRPIELPDVNGTRRVAKKLDTELDTEVE